MLELRSALLVRLPRAGNFMVGGRTLSDEVVESGADHITVRRQGQNAARRYARRGNGEFRSSRGDTYRFVSSSRGLWISGDGSTTFELRKR